MTSFIGYHLARYIGQDGVKSLVTGEEVNGQNVTWDDERVLAAAQSFADFAKKGYFSKNIATNVYPAGQNQEFAPGNAAIVICGSWLPNEAKDSVADDLEWGYFNYPSVPDGRMITQLTTLQTRYLQSTKILRCLTRHSNLSSISQQANSIRR